MKATIIFFIIATLVLGCSNIDVHLTQDASKPQNVILLIGDGMGVAQVQAGLLYNHNKLNLERSHVCGFSKTSSASDFVTDSGAGGTALATGKKTYNGAIGVDADTNIVENLPELVAKRGMVSGIISTSSVTHATPASFSAHEKSRKLEENIANDIVNAPLNVIIGGGSDFFQKRADGQDLFKSLAEKGFGVFTSLDSVSVSEKIAVFTASKATPRILDGRGDMLPKSTKIALEVLSKNSDGFFLMVEGSQIDWGGHANDIDYIATEMVDFDQVVGAAFDFADKDGNTLVIVTADHETGGLTINDGNYMEGIVEPGYTTGSHTGIMVPVFAYGPGSEKFGGIYENTAVFDKISELLELK